MSRRILILLSLIILMDVSEAAEIRSPICPVSYGNAPCIINSAQSPTLLRDYERVYFDISNGLLLNSSNFNYAGMNYKNSEIDIFSKRYAIVRIDASEAILTIDIYKNENNLELFLGSPLNLINGYTLELVDSGDFGALFSLKKDNVLIETGSVERNKIFSYTTNIDGKDVEIFRTTLMGIFEGSVIIDNTYLRDARVIKKGDRFGDFEIRLEDMDSDGDVDIAYSLKDKTIVLPERGDTPILDNFLVVRTYAAYVPFYHSLESLNLIGDDKNFRIFSLDSRPMQSVSSFLTAPPEGSIIAAGLPVSINTAPIVNYEYSGSNMSELRGDHTFYIYTKGDLSLNVQKQDMNWYNGSDALEIKAYSSSNALVKSVTIPDDGNIGNNGSRGQPQNGTLEAALNEGVYKITMLGGGADFLIRKIELNNGNIVVQNPYLAGILYTVPTNFTLYTRAISGDRLGFFTYHTEGLQVVNITGASFLSSVNVSSLNTWHYVDLPPSSENYRIEIPEGDVKLSATNYLSFSEETYFSTTSVTVLPLQNNMDWINKTRVNYVIVPSANTFTGSYFYKTISGNDYSVRSPKSPWNDYTIDTWSAPNMFYFDPERNNTWEYVIINNSVGNSINKNSMKYVAVQTRGIIGYKGALHKVLYETPSEMIISRKLTDLDNRTLFTDKEWQVGGTYTLAIKDVSTDGKSAVLVLSRSNNPVSRQVISVGDTFFYNSTVDLKDLIIFQARLNEAFKGSETSFVKLSNIELYDENFLEIKNSISTGNETASISDINGDGLYDITVTRDYDLSIEKSSRKTLFNSYLDFIVIDDGKTFYLERKIVLPSSIIDRSNIMKETTYTLAPFAPQENLMMNFSDLDITAINLNSSSTISQVKIDIKELKNRPDGIILAPPGLVYKYFSISVYEDNIKNGIIYFKVNKTWIEGQNVESNFITMLKFSDGIWEEIPSFVVGIDEKYVYYSANTKELSNIFAIAENRATKQGLSSQQVLNNEKEIIFENNDKEENVQAQITQIPEPETVKKERNTFIFSSFLMVSGVFSYYLFKKLEFIKNDKIISFLSKLSFDVFNSLLITFLVLLLMDYVWERSVSKYLDLNYLMIIVLFFGIISLFRKSSSVKDDSILIKEKKRDYIITSGIGMMGMIIIWSKIKYMGFMAFPISIVSGVLIILLSILMLEEKGTHEKKVDEEN